MPTIIHFTVQGRVQNVMFRQTFIRAAQRRNLKAAASNLPDGQVACYLEGPGDLIDDILQGLESGRPINSWGARVECLRRQTEAEGISFSSHQVTTDNVDRFNWSPNVSMYL